MDDLARYFRKGQWPAGDGETMSGTGSTIEYTQRLRAALPGLISELAVKRFLDAPCGDFNWMKEVDLSGVEYVGLDIVRDIVDENELKYGRDGVRFVHGDITVDRLPDADLMMCRDCLFHLPYKSIFKFFANFVSSSIPWLLVTSHHRCDGNVDISRVGKFRPINLSIDPFFFSEPTYWVQEHGKRGLGLWSSDDVKLVLMRHLESNGSF
jgi:SAM-dependent methyltransferase